VSRLDDLIRELSPAGVPFKPLGSLGRRNAGISITAATMKTMHVDGGPIRVYAGGQTVADVAEDDIPAGSIIRQPSIIVKSRGHIGFTFCQRPFTHKSELWSYTLTDPQVDQKFIYYYLLTKVAELQEVARATSVKLPQLGVRDTDSLRVPVPPLKVQREVARILDHFTELEAELEAGLQAEMEARRRQYSHYRTELLSFAHDQSIRRFPLRDFCEFQRGTAITAKGTRPGAVPVVANGPSSTYSHDVSNRDGGTVVVARSGAYAGLVSYWDGPIFLTDAFSVHPRTEIATSRYVFHLLQGQQTQLHAFKKGAGVPHIRVKEVESYLVPVPSLLEQERIVSILDKFDALVNDLSIALPAEIRARREQYQYYREKLLTFPEAAA
jgi:type I restriction enzyme S subunit